MKISNTGNAVTIEGNIKSIKDFQDIKNLLDDISTKSKKLSIKIIDSISITSSVIGYFTKLIYKDSINLSLSIGDKRLYDLLDELNLVSLFSVKMSQS